MSLTKKKIEKVISDVVSKHNASIEEHNEKALKHNRGKSWHDDDYMSLRDEVNQYDPNQLFEDNDLDFGDLTFKQEESFGGEGQGDSCHEVYLVTDTKTGDSAFIKFEGYYNSYDGSSYEDEFELVEPYMKQIRDWKKVK